MLIGCAHHQVDEINVVTDLSDGRAGYDSIKNGRDRLRTETQTARLILIDPNADLKEFLKRGEDP